jgi:hypothetical protein
MAPADQYVPGSFTSAEFGILKKARRHDVSRRVDLSMKGPMLGERQGRGEYHNFLIGF